MSFRFPSIAGLTSESRELYVLNQFQIPTAVLSQVVKKTEEKDTNTKGQTRVDQTSLLIRKLPKEVHCKIFEHLGPVGQRLLGATCIPLYEILKDRYYVKKVQCLFKRWENNILVSFSKDMEGITWSENYSSIMTDWLYDGPRASTRPIPKDFWLYSVTIYKEWLTMDNSRLAANGLAPDNHVYFDKGKVVIEG